MIGRDRLKKRSPPLNTRYYVLLLLRGFLREYFQKENLPLFVFTMDILFPDIYIKIHISQ